MAGHCREVSFREVDFRPTAEAARLALVGKFLYRDTKYVAMVRGEEAAVVQVLPEARPGELFREIEEMRVLADANGCRFVRDRAVDVNSPTAFQEAAESYGTPLVLEGSFNHVNFLVQRGGVEVRVLDVIPPEPKLLQQAQAILRNSELPAITLVPDFLDLREMAAHVIGPVMYPCRAAGLKKGPKVFFLDEGPRLDGPVTLVGCERSLEIFRALYGYNPPRLDFCPRKRLVKGERLLTKCCRLRGNVEKGDGWALVPWGASLEQVAEALTYLVNLAVDETNDKEEVPIDGGS